MKVTCPAVLVSFVKVQLDMRVTPFLSSVVIYTVDPGLETKVQSIAVNPVLL